MPQIVEYKDLDGDYLVYLALEFYARACDPGCSLEVYERAMELVKELKRRVRVKGG